MKTHDLVQGSPKWHAHRAAHRNASDAPAMMGCSPYMSRTELLHRCHTGIAQEVDAATQRRFDDGHRFEALARPLGEEILGQPLYPVVGTEGKYSASFDGITMMEDVIFEHKSANDDLRAAFARMRQDDNGDLYSDDVLPLAYRVQMEHQLMVSGADAALFMASKWNGDTLVEELHCWYYPDQELRALIVAGWEQFELDLLTYEPTAKEVKPEGKAPETLPALHIEISGKVMASNLVQFKDTALSAIRSVNRDLKTDQDFADAEKSVKWCEDVEGRLKAAKEHALSQTASIDELFKAIDDISAEARRVRLDLDKLVKSRKEEIRAEIVSGGVRALAEHVKALNVRLGKSLMPVIPADFAGVIKGKRSLDSIRDAVDTELARSKIAANEVADRIQVNLAKLLEREDMAFLFPDANALVLKAPEDLAATMTARIAEHQAKEEKRKAELAAAAAASEAVQKAAAAVVAPSPAPAPVVVAAPAAPAPVAADSGATVRLGEIQTRLAPITITADGLAQLGFHHVATEKASKLYRESDFPLICQALIKHLEHLAVAA